tara:strand:+ start:272 stop:586 length:315 start_codon:yes stop_codon:yes gene_type:complete
LVRRLQPVFKTRQRFRANQSIRSLAEISHVSNSELSFGFLVFGLRIIPGGISTANPASEILNSIKRLRAQGKDQVSANIVLSMGCALFLLSTLKRITVKVDIFD